MSGRPQGFEAFVGTGSNCEPRAKACVVMGVGFRLGGEGFGTFECFSEGLELFWGLLDLSFHKCRRIVHDVLNGSICCLGGGFQIAVWCAWWLP